MRYELTDNEWSAIKPMLPNKPRGGGAAGSCSLRNRALDHERKARRAEAFCDTNRSAIADDNAGSPVFLARSAWVLKREVDEWPDIAFVNVMERN